MTAERSDLQNAFETTLSSQMGPTDLTASVASIGALTSPCILVIEPDSDTQREFIRFNGTFGGSSFVTTSDEPPGRYLGGSAAGSNLTHPVGSVVASVSTKDHFHDIHDRIDETDNTAVALEAEFDSHHGGVAATDHPEATTSARGFMSAADKTLLDDVVDGSEILVVSSGHLQLTETDLSAVGTFYGAEGSVTVPADWNSCHVSVIGHGSMTTNGTIAISGYATDATAAKVVIGDAIARNSFTHFGFRGILSNPGTSIEIGLKMVISGSPGASDALWSGSHMFYVLTRAS